jgi:hypothetical protein
MPKIKYKDVKTIRDEYIINQSNKCMLCDHDLDSPCLDHNHRNGEIRGVLCRGCNLFLGKIEKNLAICRITNDKLYNIITNLIPYMSISSDMIHPTHKIKKIKK